MARKQGRTQRMKNLRLRNQSVRRTNSNIRKGNIDAAVILHEVDEAVEEAVIEVTGDLSAIADELEAELVTVRGRLDELENIP